MIRPTLTLFRREFTAYFHSPIAYVVLAAFLAGTGYLFFLTFDLLTQDGPVGVEWPMQSMFGGGYFWLPFLVIPAVLTMRSFAEERGSGTLELLLTAPLRDWQVVLAKYAACFAFYIVLWLPTLLYVPVLFGFRQTGADEVYWNWSTWTTGLAAALVASALLLLLWRLPVHGSIKFLLFMIPLPVATFLAEYNANHNLTTGLSYAGTAAAGAGIAFVVVYLLVWGFTALFRIRDSYRTSAVLAILFTIQSIGAIALLAGAMWVDDVRIPRAFATTYLGLFLAGAMFLSLGLFVSSLVKSQLVAVLVSMVVSIVFVAAAFARPYMETSGLPYQLVYFFSVPLHFRSDFTRGVIDSRHLILYGSVALFFLFMTVRSLEARRWR